MTLSGLEQMALGSFRDEVQRVFGARVSAVRLFGSRARGEGRADSDFDILALVDDVSREERGQILDAGADVSTDLERGRCERERAGDDAASG